MIEELLESCEVEPTFPPFGECISAIPVSGSETMTMHTTDSGAMCTYIVQFNCFPVPAAAYKQVVMML